MTSLLKRLGVELPIIQAPMAGTSTPALAAAVSNAGALGSIGVGAVDAAGARGMIENLVGLTNKPFNVNVFTHRPARADPERESAWLEALKPEFKTYAKNVVENAKALAEVLKGSGLDIVTGGTDTHLMLVDLRPKGAKGRPTEHALDRAGITCNKNAVPFDTEKAVITSGIRLGSPAGTTRGFGVAEFREIGRLIAEVEPILRPYAGSA